jgi:hypothetical protein
MKKTNDFSMVIIPDTQDLCTSHPVKLKKMAQWIVDNREAQNIKTIIHVGDVVNNGALRKEQWENHREAFALIEDANVPSMIAIGNHDYDNILNENRDSKWFNMYCGVSNYQNKRWFGGVFENGKAENMYIMLEIEDKSYLFLSLEFGPRDEVIDWANHILEEYEDHETIVVTHSYMFLNGERTKQGDAHNPKNYKGTQDANDGEDLWHKCLKHHKNVTAVYSGHHIPDNVSYRFDVGDKGNLVFQSFQNWQCAENGGDGRIRIIRYKEDSNEIEMNVFNPQTEQWESESGFDISIPIKAESSEHKRLLTYRHPSL